MVFFNEAKTKEWYTVQSREPANEKSKFGSEGQARVDSGSHRAVPSTKGLVGV